MSTFIAALANRLASTLAPVSTYKNEKDQSAVLFRPDGSISLNLENKEVQERIALQLEELGRLKKIVSREVRPKVKVHQED